MRTNHVKAKLKRGKPSVGAWLSLPDRATARIMARLGFDWLLIDGEHAAQHPGIVSDMVGIIADAGTSAPLVRIPYNSVEWFKWALDAGAWGLIVPMVNTPQEAQQAVACSKYPPQGMRSIGGVFGPYSFGLMDATSYREIANSEILLVVQIESVQGLANVDGILSVPGIDVAFVGPNDLHAQLGLPVSTEGAEPEFVQALETIKAAAKRHDLASGIFCSNGQAAAQRIGEGFQMVNATSDISSLVSGAVFQLKEALG
ncbi:MAG TPA: aldolase/citrate lyase family protein [Ktedonobacteraceae bacterium]|nr:aldolase/citrate lyase family protein [Ktedonobacteraceae bacterium]